MTSVLAGQTDLFDLLEPEPAPTQEQPPIRVLLSGWRGKSICGWCGGSSVIGGGGCRHPENTVLSIGYDYCQRCADKNGYPRMFKGGTPIIVTTDDGKRIACPCCLSSWGVGLKAWVLESHAREHAVVDPGLCAFMVRRGVTEPFYTPRESPWESGFVTQYPRPEGFGGLYQLGVAA